MTNTNEIRKEIVNIVRDIAMGKYDEPRLAVDQIMQLLAKHEEEIIADLESQKKYFAQLAMTEDVFAWNEAIDKAISIITKNSQEGEK